MDICLRDEYILYIQFLMPDAIRCSIYATAGTPPCILLQAFTQWLGKGQWVSVVVAIQIYIIISALRLYRATLINKDRADQ